MFEFIENGGLFGKMRGYNAKREGRPYGFPEFKEDTDVCISVLENVLGLAGRCGIGLSNRNNDYQRIPYYNGSDDEEDDWDDDDDWDNDEYYDDDDDDDWDDDDE